MDRRLGARGSGPCAPMCSMSAAVRAMSALCQGKSDLTLCRSFLRPRFAPRPGAACAAGPGTHSCWPLAPPGACITTSMSRRSNAARSSHISHLAVRFGKTRLTSLPKSAGFKGALPRALTYDLYARYTASRSMFASGCGSEGSDNDALQPKLIDVCVGSAYLCIIIVFT